MMNPKDFFNTLDVIMIIQICKYMTYEKFQNISIYVFHAGFFFLVVITCLDSPYFQKNCLELFAVQAVFDFMTFEL